MPNTRADTWDAGPVPAVPVDHQGPPPVILWKTQCAPSSLLAECSSMECQGIDLVWLWSCASLGAQPGECGACALAV